MNYDIQGTFVTWQVKTFTCQVIKGTLKSVIITQIPWLKLNPPSAYFVVILLIFCLSQVIFGFLLLLGMLMYANEVETIRKIKIMWGKINYNIYIIFNKVKSLICRNSKGIYSMLYSNKASKLKAARSRQAKPSFVFVFSFTCCFFFFESWCWDSSSEIYLNDNFVL